MQPDPLFILSCGQGPQILSTFSFATDMQTALSLITRTPYVKGSTISGIYKPRRLSVMVPFFCASPCIITHSGCATVRASE